MINQEKWKNQETTLIDRSYQGLTPIWGYEKTSEMRKTAGEIVRLDLGKKKRQLKKINMQYPLKTSNNNTNNNIHWNWLILFDWEKRNSFQSTVFWKPTSNNKFNGNISVV